MTHKEFQRLALKHGANRFLEFKNSQRKKITRVRFTSDYVEMWVHFSEDKVKSVLFQASGLTNAAFPLDKVVELRDVCNSVIALVEEVGFGEA